MSEPRMNETERKALAALTFNWAPTREDVWQPLTAHVDELNEQAERQIRVSFDEAKSSLMQSPMGVALLGQQGAGKTHLLQWARELVQREGGYFFIVGLLQGKDFWQNIVHAMLDDLGRGDREGDDQASSTAA
jgi:DNA replication protein DnaC